MPAGGPFSYTINYWSERAWSFLEVANRHAALCLKTAAQWWQDFSGIPLLEDGFSRDKIEFQMMPWAPLASPARFFLVRARRSARTLVTLGVSSYIDARYGSRPSECIRRFRVHCGYTGRAGYTGSPLDCEEAFRWMN